MIYTNNLKNREFDKETPQIFCSKQVTIAEEQGVSENKKSEAQPTQLKTDSSSCLCLYWFHLKVMKISSVASIYSLLLFLSFTPFFASEETPQFHSSFSREVLQPLGMPLVSVYYEIRESSFLNLHRTDAIGLEAAGDLFLTPSRYLFGGKDFLIYGNECQIRPSFRYKHMGWLKTTLSLIALPLSQIIGAACKAVSWFSLETQYHYRMIRHTLEDPILISHLEEYMKKGVSQFHSEANATSLGLSRPSILSKTHQMELLALKEICKLFDEHGIIYWLDCGSCLGAYRYGGIIPWDDDIDISILSSDHDNVKKLLSTLDPEEFQIQDWSSYRYPKTFLKLYIKKTKTLIDIYHYDLNEKTQTASYFYSYKDSALPEDWKKIELSLTLPISYSVMFPLKRAYFDGIPTWVPNQIEPFLHSKYGKNLSPTMVWDELSHTYLKVKDHPYWNMSFGAKDAER